jgi:uncharacterized protein (DUF952 family)
MRKDIFDIVLIRRLMRQQRWNEAKDKDKTIFNQSIKDSEYIKRSSACRVHNFRVLLTDERMNF